MRIVLFMVFLMLAVGVGCSSQRYMREDFQKKIGLVSPHYDEHNIQKIFEKKVNLPKPFTIAVYFKSPPQTDGGGTWRWTLKDKTKFVEKMREAVSPEVVSNIFIMENNANNSADLKDLRLSAAQYGADAMMVVQGVTDTHRTRTPWASSYVLVLPALFVNGNQVQTYFNMQASLWDVRNEMLYLTMSSEGDDLEKYPAALWKEDAVYMEKTKQMALSNMVQDMQKNLSALNK